MNAIEKLKSVLCDQEGKCSITGSDEDRALVDAALAELTVPKDVQEAANYLKQNEYRGPLSFAQKVIDFLAN